MESIQIDITVEKLRKALQASCESVLSSSYDSPIRKAMEEAIKDKTGEIRLFVDSIITDAITNPDFKTQIAAEVMKRMIESALKK